jgi:PAT family beta-lactamase induction signal transducer AmpG
MSQLAEPGSARLSILFDPRLWLMAAFGFVSGLPLALSGFTLKQWLTESGASLHAIGLTSNIGLAYTLKFLWAPLLDRLPPGLLARAGRRRGWLFCLQPPLVLATVALALSDAATAPLAAIAAASAVALFSATQDIAIDAWRIEAFPVEQQGEALAAYVWGYRVAMMVSGAGVIWAAGTLGWHGALAVVAVLLAAGLLVTWRAPEPTVLPAPRQGGVMAAIATPLKAFLAQPGAGIALLYVALFYLGEAMAGAMLAPLYRHLGFDRAAVAAATGPFALAATLSGVAVGGWLVARIGLARALISTGFGQMTAMALYVLLANTPGDHTLLYCTVVLEAFVQALASAAFLAFLSGLCTPGFAATQYALLNSVAALASHSVGGLSGFLAEAVGWTGFYLIAMAASLPAMMVMLHMLRRRSASREVGPAHLPEPERYPSS